MITGNDLKAVFESSEFRSELEELSAYAANIRQERPIVLFVAKYFWRRHRKFELEKKLEKNRVDLVVEGTHIEFKFHFDREMFDLRKELSRFDGDVKRLMEAVINKEHHPRWTVCAGIYKDIVKPSGTDIFVWVLCARDLRKLTNDEIGRVCSGAQQRKHNKRTPFESNLEFLEVANTFLAKLQKFRRFSLEKSKIITHGDFPCEYHLIVCDFATLESN